MTKVYFATRMGKKKKFNRGGSTGVATAPPTDRLATSVDSNKIKRKVMLSNSVVSTGETGKLFLSLKKVMLLTAQCTSKTVI